MVEHIKKAHNVSLLIYHIVCPVKYRRKVFTKDVEEALKEICLELEKRYEVSFVEIGIDEDHVHFLVQTIPNMSPTEVVTIIKGNTSREVFQRHPEVKSFLWGGNFWTSGYYINTVGNANMTIVKNYVKRQKIPGYIQIHTNQPTLF